MSKAVHVAFVGNPNCGKTTLFNAIAGTNLKVANWPGVTVEKVEGKLNFQGQHFILVDLPGTYSLTSYTMEEIVARDYIMSDEVDIIINVVDASSLERNLYLTLQLLELGKPVVMALNMMDIIKERGLELDLHRLPEMLGIPVIPVSARKKTGLKTLMHAVQHHSERHDDKIEHHDHGAKNSAGTHHHSHHDEYAMVYDDDIEDRIDFITALLKGSGPSMSNYRWHAIKLLEHDAEVMKTITIDLQGLNDKNFETEILNERYTFIEEIMEEVLPDRDMKSESTDRADRLLTHRVLGIPIFLCIMAAVFLLTFTLGDFIKGYLELALEWFGGAAEGMLLNISTNPILTSMIVDGIIAGVGGILTFLPNIIILFIALAFLEDSGYMARVAYVMDGVMSKIGLSGRAFIPMILGFGCTVPAVMASRALENPRDRLKTILATPFMSCSAKIPVYVLISGIFFGGYAPLAAFSMYLIGLMMAILVAFAAGRLDKKKEENTLLIELPEYKTPNPRTVYVYVSQKVKDYLTKAGTTIFMASILLWLLLNFGSGGYVGEGSIADSFAAKMGAWLVPVLTPAGLGFWQIAVALISGLAAKEVVVSSISILFGIAEADSAALSTHFAQIGFGPVNAFALMLFVLLYVPCLAALAVIKRETRSWKWTGVSIAIQLGTAWIVSTLFFQIVSLFIK
ncbi:MAG: ferrous iron transport protein B [Oscillospiraceae bacterium]|jgi:ferrous iron transport protein B|nr:ferrous iron transport protein B [Oscillospiraceae bacterium]